MTILTSLPCAPIASATEHASKGNRNNPNLNLTLTFALALLLSTTAGPAHAQMNYKWVDGEGETIYEPIPPDDPDQPYCERSGDGPWTCFEGADRLVRPAPDPDAMTPEKLQQREDQLLITRFRSLEAIESGRKDRLRQLDFERKTVLNNMESQRRTLFNQIRAAADRQRAGLSVPQRQLDSMATTRSNLGDASATLARIDGQAEEINQEFDAMKARYRELLEAQTAP